MEANGIEKKELADYRLSTRKSSSVEITDEEQVFNYLNANPQYKESCVKTEVTTKLIKTGLKELLTDTEIPGVQIVESKNVTIK